MRDRSAIAQDDGGARRIGVLLLDTSSFGIRSTAPNRTKNNIILPGIVWTPGDVLGGRLNLIDVQPYVSTRPAAGGHDRSGIGVPLVAAQVAWKIAPNFSVSYLLGGQPAGRHAVRDQSGLDLAALRRDL